MRGFDYCIITILNKGGFLLAFKPPRSVPCVLKSIVKEWFGKRARPFIWFQARIHHALSFSSFTGVREPKSGPPAQRLRHDGRWQPGYLRDGTLTMCLICAGHGCYPGGVMGQKFCPHLHQVTIERSLLTQAEQKWRCRP